MCKKTAKYKWTQKPDGRIKAALCTSSNTDSFQICTSTFPKPKSFNPSSIASETLRQEKLPVSSLTSICFDAVMCTWLGSMSCWRRSWEGLLGMCRNWKTETVCCLRADCVFDFSDSLFILGKWSAWLSNVLLDMCGGTIRVHYSRLSSLQSTVGGYRWLWSSHYLHLFHQITPHLHYSPYAEP